MPRLVRFAAAGLLPAALLAAAARTGEGRRDAGEGESPPRLTGWPAAADELGPEAIRALPSGLRRLTADGLWLRAVQHYGTRRRAEASGYPLLAPLATLALRFDPELRAAAVDGALLLAEPPPLGAAAPDLAEALLADWTRRRPGDWRAVLLLGLIREWHRGDPAAAAAAFREAAERPGAPDYLLALAARSGTAAGDRAGARAIWSALAREAETPRQRANAETHLLQIAALDRRDELAAAAAAFRRRTGRFPGTWDDLDEAAGSAGPPLDPAGTPFQLLPEGVVRISPESPLAGHPERGRGGASGRPR